MGELGKDTPTVLVLKEIFHWANEATLDVVRLLGRRVESAPALVLVSYRDELDRVHPLRILTGELATSPSVTRLRVESLSPERAVARLAEPNGIDAEDLYRKTGGNPFFVTEVLAGGDAEIPNTVRDAVLARAARLGPTARALLEAVAVVPPHGEIWLWKRSRPRPSIESMNASLRHVELRMRGSRLPPRAPLGWRSRSRSRRTGDFTLHRKALAASRLRLWCTRYRAARSPCGGGRRHGRGVALRVWRRPSARLHSAPIERPLPNTLVPSVSVTFCGPSSGLDSSASAVECYLLDENKEAIEAQRFALDCYRALGDRRQGGWLASSPL